MPTSSWQKRKRRGDALRPAVAAVAAAAATARQPPRSRSHTTWPWALRMMAAAWEAKRTVGCSGRRCRRKPSFWAATRGCYKRPRRGLTRRHASPPPPWRPCRVRRHRRPAASASARARPLMRAAAGPRHSLPRAARHLRCALHGACRSWRRRWRRRTSAWQWSRRREIKPKGRCARLGHGSSSSSARWSGFEARARTCATRSTRTTSCTATSR